MESIDLDLSIIMQLCYAVIIICGSSLAFVGCNPAGQNTNCLEQMRECPSTFPILCPPHGNCCRYSQFCYKGLCETCFPEDVSESDLQSWCRRIGQYNVSLMRNTACQFACLDRFTPQELNSNCMQNDSYTTSTQSINDGNHHNFYLGLLDMLNEKLNDSCKAAIKNLQNMNDGSNYNSHLLVTNTILVFVVVIAIKTVAIPLLTIAVCGLISCKTRFLNPRGKPKKELTDTTKKDAESTDNSSMPLIPKTPSNSQLSQQLQNDPSSASSGHISTLEGTLPKTEASPADITIDEEQKINKELEAQGPPACYSSQPDIALDKKNAKKKHPYSL